MVAELPLAGAFGLEFQVVAATGLHHDILAGGQLDVIPLVVAHAVVGVGLDRVVVGAAFVDVAGCQHAAAVQDAPLQPAGHRGGRGKRQAGNPLVRTGREPFPDGLLEGCGVDQLVVDRAAFHVGDTLALTVGQDHLQDGREAVATGADFGQVGPGKRTARTTRTLADQGGPVQGVQPASRATVLQRGDAVVAADEVLVSGRIGVLHHQVVDAAGHHRLALLVHPDFREHRFRVVARAQTRHIGAAGHRGSLQVGQVLGRAVVRVEADPDHATGAASIAQAALPVQANPIQRTVDGGPEAVGHDAGLVAVVADDGVGQCVLREHAGAVEAGKFRRVQLQVGGRHQAVAAGRLCPAARVRRLFGGRFLRGLRAGHVLLRLTDGDGVACLVGVAVRSAVIARPYPGGQIGVIGQVGGGPGVLDHVLTAGSGSRGSVQGRFGRGICDQVIGHVRQDVAELVDHDMGRFGLRQHQRAGAQGVGDGGGLSQRVGAFVLGRLGGQDMRHFAGNLVEDEAGQCSGFWRAGGGGIISTGAAGQRQRHHQGGAQHGQATRERAGKEAIGLAGRVHD